MIKLLPSWWKSRILARSAIDNRYALLEACLIGILSGISALFLKAGISLVGGWRIKTSYLFNAHLSLPLAGLLLGCLAGWGIELLAPSAAGGGIPQVKAVLARYPTLINLRVALVKTLGTMLVLGAGLTLGRRGPTVHIGAALAAQLSRWIPNSPTNRRQMIAAGAAAGLAAGFNTPIAGVLFVAEELMRDISGLTLESAILASFIGAVVSRLFGASELNLSLAGRTGSFTAAEIPFYLILGIFAGILGGLFNRGTIWSTRIHRRLPISMPLRIGLAGLISGLVISFLPNVFWDHAGLRIYLISGNLSWQTTAIAFAAYFFLTILAYTAGAPGGLFAPALVLGAALGYLVGTAEFSLMSEIAPFTFAFSTYTFALAGMGAFFTAVVRVPVTAIVIVFEMTGDFNVVLPLMISSVVAYVIADSFAPGSIYEHLLDVSGIHLDEGAPTHDFLTELTAEDVMQSQVETLATSLTIEEVVKAMSLSHHRGFPVVEDGKLVGIITQSDIADDRKKTGSTFLRDIMTPQPITVSPDISLADVLYLLNRYQLSRLPVTEGQKLVGIITRSDIIKVEAQKLSGDRDTLIQAGPSYIVYQTRSPSTGRGRILLPIANPEHAHPLMKMAIAIARYQKYEIECLQIISVPNYVSPSQATVDISGSRHLMHRMERWGRKEHISVHTQVVVATDISTAILETATHDHVNLLLMGWKGTTDPREQIFGNIVDKVIEHSACELLLVKLGSTPRAFPQDLDHQGKWLIPITKGGKLPKTMKILPGLVNLYHITQSPQINLCQIYLPTEEKTKFKDVTKLAQAIADKTNVEVRAIPLCAHSVPEAVINLCKAESYNFVILGASNKGLLHHGVWGNIPEAIASKLETTVLIVRI
ncbi:MAG: chloride channel protein [Xenococcus sp. MO_188.B8]|nr:chloride channel protein [Xenococcus sp. MO_188.B8]